MRCYARAALPPMSSCSVCLSVTFMISVKTNKHIFKIFSPLGNQAILVLYQMAWQYSDGNPLMGPTGALNAGGVGRNRDSEPIPGFTACCQCYNRPDVINTEPPDHSPHKL